MYDVVVNAKYVSTNYSKDANATSIGSRPLANRLGSIPGWNGTVTLTGKHFD